MNLKTKEIDLIICIFCIATILGSLKSNAQSKVEGNLVYYIKDSCLMKFNMQNESVRLIYKPTKGSKILDFASNWKQGILILLENSTHTYIVQMKSIYNTNVDTIYYLYKSDGEGSQSIANIDISPTGDFMVMNMGFWEGHGIRFYDFRKDTVLEYVRDKIYFSDFIQWLPFNSVLAMCAYGSEVDGPGELIIYNFNLENQLFKSWSIPMTIYEGFQKIYNDILILCSPKDSSGKLNGLRLYQADLLQILDTSDKSTLLINLNEGILKAKIKQLTNYNFQLALVNTKDNKLILDVNYKLEYSQFDWFGFKSINFNKDTKTIIVNFNVALIFNKYSRTNYGSVSYYIDLSGKLFKKVYNNVDIYRLGFSTERYEHFFNSEKSITKKYINDKYSQTFERKALSSPVQSEIIIK